MSTSPRNLIIGSAGDALHHERELHVSSCPLPAGRVGRDPENHREDFSSTPWMVRSTDSQDAAACASPQ
eukprot:1816353-Prymnesium_polylepis.3